MTVDPITKNPIERELWRQWQANPSDALRDRILPFYGLLVKQQAARFLSAGVMADMEFGDLYSEGWIGLCGAFDSFDTARGAFSTWASVKVRYAILGALKLHTTKAEKDAECLYDVLSDSPDADDILIHLALKVALAQLPDRDREIVVAHDVEEYSYRELAGIFGVSHTRVNILHSRAIGRMKNILHFVLNVV